MNFLENLKERELADPEFKQRMIIARIELAKELAELEKEELGKNMIGAGSGD